MRAAFWRRHGIAIAGRHAIGIADACPDPADGPLDAAMSGIFCHLAGKRHGRNRRAPANMLFQIIFQTIGKFQHVFSRRFVGVLDEFRRAPPTNFDTPEQIGFGL